ncbi:MAG: hypothetical protein ACJ71W_21840 [Terriglobales bacterium]
MNTYDQTKCDEIERLKESQGLKDHVHIAACPSCGTLVQAVDEFDGSNIKIKYRLITTTPAKPSLGRRIYRGALWLVVTAAIVAAMWLGIHGTKPAWNVFVFLQWLNTMIWIMLYSARNEKKFFSDFPAQSFPAWVYSVSDLAIALVLAAFGHFVYASFSIIQMLCEQSFYDARAKGQEPKAKS